MIQDKLTLEQVMKYHVGSTVTTIKCGAVTLPGAMDIIVGTNDGKVMLLNTNLGAVSLIEKDTPIVDIALGDIDGDGIKEVIYLRMGGYVGIIKNRNLKMEISIRTKLKTIDACDINNDGRDEIIVGGAMVLIEVKPDGSTSQIIRVLQDIERVKALRQPLMGKPRIIVGTIDGRIMLLEGSKELWMRDTREKPYSLHYATINDKIYIVVVGGENVFLYSADGQNINVQQVRMLPKVSSVGSIYGDRKDYLVVGGDDMKIYVLDIKTLSIISSQEVDRDITAIKIADINNDYVDEIIIGDSSGNVVIYENKGVTKEYGLLEQYGKVFLQLCREGKATADELFVSGIPSEMIYKTIEYVKEEPNISEIESYLPEIDKESKKLASFDEVPSLDALVIEKKIPIKIAKGILWFLKNFHTISFPVQRDSSYEARIRSLVPYFRSSTPILKIVKETGEGIVSIKKARDYYSRMVARSDVFIPIGKVEEISESVEKQIDDLIEKFERKKLS
ncbi:MAG: hypothetical protein QXL15_02440 [Candidatus Korarchaeota archaeon]